MKLVRPLAAVFALLAAASPSFSADPREGRYEPYLLNVAEQAFLSSWQAYTSENQSDNMAIAYWRLYSGYGNASWAWDVLYTPVLAGTLPYDAYASVMANVYTDLYYAYLYAYAAYQDKKGTYTLATLNYCYYAQIYARSAKSTPAPTIPTDSNGLTPDLASLLSHLNYSRTQQGNAALTIDARLNAAAQKHANWMAIHGVLSDAGSGGSTVVKRIQAEGYTATVYYQNIGAGYDTDQLMMNAWLANTAQKRAILNTSYKQVGLGVAKGLDSRRYWVAVFAAPK